MATKARKPAKKVRKKLAAKPLAAVKNLRPAPNPPSTPVPIPYPNVTAGD